MKAVVSDHTFPSLDLQRKVINAAGFELSEIQPICKTEEDVIEHCSDADALLVQWAPITRRTLKAFPHLKGVVRYGVGVNNVDLDAARELKIGVANIPTYCLEEVSNHAMAMMLGLARRIPQDQYRILHGEWGVGPLLPIPAFIDMTLGLVGFGAIARLVARKARAFGFRIVASDPYLQDSVFSENGVERLDLEALLRSADIISLHCPLVSETTHLINRNSIDKMRPGVLLINTSRGPIIKESDLADALADGRVLGAGLDVFEEEPLPADSPLRSLSNVILTSHAASVSTRAVEALQIKAAESARDFMQGKRPEGALVWPGESAK
jgi:D-3-phosphoglycerate dehydrogenase